MCNQLLEATASRNTKIFPAKSLGWEAGSHERPPLVSERHNFFWMTVLEFSFVSALLNATA